MKKKVKDIFNKIVKNEKKIDVILNNAAVSFFSEILKKNDKETDLTYKVNLKGVINITNEYLRIHKQKTNEAK